MGKAVSRGQALQVSARVATQVNWDEPDGDDLQREIIDLTPEEFGRRFTAFIKSGARMSLVGDFKVATVEFDPIIFIGKGWKIVSEEQDEKSAALPEIDFANARFISCLDKDENSIKGEEKLRRLKESGDIRLGATVFMGLWNDYQADRENSVLECLHKEGIIGSYVDFFGTILLCPNGRRRVLDLSRSGGGRWRWDADWLGGDWAAGDLSVVLPQV